MLFEVSVPLPAERLSLNFSVVPLTSRIPLLPKVPPWEKENVPPVEVMDPTVSWRGYGRIKSAAFVMSFESELSTASADCIVRSVVAEPSVSVKLFKPRPPITIAELLEIVVAAFSSKDVVLSVCTAPKLLYVPPSPSVPPVIPIVFVPGLMTVFFKLRVLSFVIPTLPASVNEESNNFNSPPEIAAPEFSATEPPVKSRLALSRATLPLNVSDPALDSIVPLSSIVPEPLRVRLPV